MFFPSYIEYLKANWRLLTLPYDENFSQAFQLVHQAVQFLAMSCKSIFPPRFDDSHTSFHWDYQRNCFATDWMHFKHTVRLELCPETLTLTLVSYRASSVDSFSLAKKTKMEVYGRLRQMLQEGGVKIERFVNEMHYDIPDHEVCKGGRFTMDNEKYNKELVNHYANAFMLLHRFTANTPEVSDIRCWPHHFDLTLNMSYTFEPGGKKRFLKIGYSPANPDVQEPHFFIRLAENNNSIRLYGKPKYAHYFPDTKTGIYLPLGDLVEKKTINAQTAVLSNYLKESFEIIR